MKRRKAGVVHTNWDHIWIKWSGSQRWWEVPGDWKSFTKAAADLSQRVLVKEEDEKKGKSFEEGREKDKSKAEEERRKKAMEERGAQRIWDLAWGRQMKVQLLWGL